MLASSIASMAQTNNQSESDIRSLAAGFAKSWNEPGMPGFGDLFAEDADFVVITGRWLKGRSEIVSYHRDLLATYYKGSHLSPVQVWVRFVHPDSAVVHVAWNASYTQDGKEQSRTALMTLTVTKQEDKWKIAAAHNTLTGGPGSMGN
jgi:uncharacterized protein (TIGR02246 family)